MQALWLAQVGAACSNECSWTRRPATLHPATPSTLLCLLRAEAFEAIWGAIYADDSFRMERVKDIYASLYPLAVTTAPAS